MSTTGKSRIIAMILVVAMLLAMVPTAAFASQVNPNPSKPKIVIGETGASAADITFEETSDAEWGAPITVTVTVDDSETVNGSKVEWATSPTVTGANADNIGFSDNMLTFQISGDDTTKDKVTISNIKYDVLSGAATGYVNVEININNGAEVITTENAEIVDGIVVAAESKPTIALGSTELSAQPAGNVTLTESNSGLLEDEKTFTLSIPSTEPGVTFNQIPNISDDQDSLTFKNPTLSSDKKSVSWTVDTPSTTKAKVTISGIKYNIDTTAEKGDISLEVSSDGTKPIVPTQVANATITGQVSVTATTTNVSAGADDQTAGNVTLTEGEAGLLTVGSNITLTINDGSGATFTTAPTATVSGVELVSNTATLSPNHKEASWSVKTASTTAGRVEISGIRINVPETATSSTPVTVEVVAPGVTPATTKTIAYVTDIARATVKATEILALEKNMAGQAAGDIVITEVEAGRLAAGGEGITLTIFGQSALEKPQVTFAGKPVVKVTSGDIEIDYDGIVLSGSTDGGNYGNYIVTIPVDAASTSASEITISGIKYDVTAGAADGNVVLDVAYNGTRLGTAVNGFIGELVVEPTFPDAADSHWAFTYIEGLVALDIISGYTDGTFKPSNTITRAEFAKMACTAAGIGPITVDTPSFSDIDGHWAEGYIEAAKDAGIIGGYPDGTFRPNNNVTRAEIAKMVVGAAGLAIDTSGAGFSDVAADHWAHDYILTAANNGIVGGYPDGTFRPNNSATRAEASKMVYVWVTTLK